MNNFLVNKNYFKILGHSHNRKLFGFDSLTASALPIEIEKILTLPKISKEVKEDILYNYVNDLPAN